VAGKGKEGKLTNWEGYSIKIPNGRAIILYRVRNFLEKERYSITISYPLCNI